MSICTFYSRYTADAETKKTTPQKADFVYEIQDSYVACKPEKRTALIFSCLGMRPIMLASPKGTNQAELATVTPTGH